MSRFEQDRQQESRDARIAAQTEAFKKWLADKHPEIYFCTAFFNELKEYMQGSFFTAGDEDFEYAVQNIDTKGVRQHVPTPEETKAALIDKICSLLTSADGTGRDGKFDSHSLNAERTKMNFWTVPQLTTRLEEVIRKQQLSKAPIGELQKIVQSGRRYEGYPQLGQSIVRPGTVHAVALDAEYLRDLDSWDLKRLCRLYGISQVNDRLAGKK